MSLARALVILLTAIAGTGCGSERVAPSRRDVETIVRSADADADSQTSSPPVPTSSQRSAEPSDAALAVAPPSDTDTVLRGEAAEGNPRSSTVTLKLAITPAARGTVYWGRKKLADLQSGKMTVEVERPRSSGPLDLLIRADGFLPHHVRLFTDRNDKLSVRLVRVEEAHSLFGYRRAPVPNPP